MHRDALSPALVDFADFGLSFLVFASISWYEVNGSWSSQGWVRGMILGTSRVTDRFTLSQQVSNTCGRSVVVVHHAGDGSDPWIAEVRL